MSIDWANSGVDLLLELPGGQRRAGLEYALRDAVRSGRLVPGTLLPSSRALAAELGMARNTVADAYGQLVAEGWLTARQGAGTRVAARTMPVTGHATVPHQTMAPGRRTYDLTPGRPDLAGFPRSGWLAAARRAITAAPSHELGYPDPRGLPGLRDTLAQYLARVRGVRTTPDRIIICSGFVQALHLLSVALCRLGASTIAVESYGFGLHRDVIRAAGLATRPVTVDGSGARVGELAAPPVAGAPVAGAPAAAAPAGAVLLTPAHQFPLGVALTAQRRAAVLGWARDSGALIIEDDYDGEFRYDRRPLGALQSLAPDLVAYAGTASKSLAPGLSLAWLVLPPHLVDLLVETKRLSVGRTGVLAHAVLRLGRNLRQPDEAGILSRAARAGLTIQGLGDFRYDGHLGYHPGRNTGPGHASGPGPSPGPGSASGSGQDTPAALVVGYGTPPDHAFSGALDTLCDVLG